MVNAVDAEEFWGAFKHVLDALGVTPHQLLATPFSIEWAGEAAFVCFRKVVEKDAPREHWPIVASSDDGYGEWVYDVRVPILGAFPNHLWSNGKYPEGIAVQHVVAKDGA